MCGSFGQTKNQQWCWDGYRPMQASKSLKNLLPPWTWTWKFLFCCFSTSSSSSAPLLLCHTSSNRSFAPEDFAEHELVPTPNQFWQNHTWPLHFDIGARLKIYFPMIFIFIPIFRKLIIDLLKRENCPWFVFSCWMGRTLANQNKSKMARNFKIAS